jgi:hypothetical protein
MDAKLKIVTHLPLRELHRDDGFTTTSRGRALSKDVITNLLRAGPVQFVVADVGTSPRWIPLHECHQFWKDEVQPHLAADAKIVLDEFPVGYCYLASAWDNATGEAPIVVLETSH